eukprot:scaffold319_cov362-Pavlova_lutheri.AAC.23
MDDLSFLCILTVHPFVTKFFEGLDNLSCQELGNVHGSRSSLLSISNRGLTEISFLNPLERHFHDHAHCFAQWRCLVIKQHPLTEDQGTKREWSVPIPRINSSRVRLYLSPVPAHDVGTGALDVRPCQIA